MAFDVRFDRIKVGSAIADDEAPRSFIAFSFTQQESDFDRAAGLQFDLDAQSPTRVKARSDSDPGDAAALESAVGFASVPFRPINSRRSPSIRSEPRTNRRMRHASRS